jgi:hypothetical protein
MAASGSRVASLALALAIAVPSSAAAVPVALYPLDGRDIARALRMDLQRLVIRGALTVSDEEEGFEPREPMALPPRCGAANSANRACLARLAGDGALLVGQVEREGQDVLVTLWLIDGKGRLSPTVWFRQSTAVLADPPATQAVRELARALAAGLRRPAKGSAGHDR